MDALLFDCDGVLVDTERDGHRVAFNQAFASMGIDVTWQVDEYKALVKIAGGKERMKHYFDQHVWPETSDRDALIKKLHQVKTDLFMALIETKALPLRSGVSRLVDEAIAKGVKIAVCSTSNVDAVTRIVEVLLGDERKKHLKIFAGDMVAKKKPDPAIYNLCIETLGIDPATTVVVEDNRNGLLAAKAAGCNCIITTNDYTIEEDFTEADAIYAELGDAPAQVTIGDLNAIVDRVAKQ